MPPSGPQPQWRFPRFGERLVATVVDVCLVGAFDVVVVVFLASMPRPEVVIPVSLAVAYGALVFYAAVQGAKGSFVGGRVNRVGLVSVATGRPVGVWPNVKRVALLFGLQVVRRPSAVRTVDGVAAATFIKKYPRAPFPDGPLA